MAKVIAVNAGSSSLKFKLFDMPAEKVICSGLAEKIGHEDAIFSIKPAGKDKNETICAIKDHAVAVDMLLEALIEYDIVKSLDEIKVLVTVLFKVAKNSLIQKKSLIN